MKRNHNERTGLHVALIDECMEDQMYIQKALSRFENITFHSFHNVTESVNYFLDNGNVNQNHSIPDLIIIDDVQNKNTFESLKILDKFQHGFESLFILMRRDTEAEMCYDHLRVNTFEKPGCFNDLRSILEVIVEKEMIGKAVNKF